MARVRFRDLHTPALLQRICANVDMDQVAAASARQDTCYRSRNLTMARRSILPALLILIFAASPVPAHRHVSGGPREAPAAATARYPTDAEHRRAMERVRDAVQAFEHARHGHMGREQVRALSAHLDAQVTIVFSECRLEPEAGASLRVILGTLLKGSRAMRQTPDDFAPVAAMERALADYARMFDDPDARAAR